MLKRIKYISAFAQAMSQADIDELVRSAAEANAKHEITGVLMASGELFFQIVEGPATAIDELWDKLLHDERHREVTLLQSEQGDLVRLFPDWAMKKVDLSYEASVAREPIHALIRAVRVQTQLVESLIGTIEQAMWHDLRSAE